ncbi:MAG: TonB-dependent receptor [Candidatus Saccharimonas sp.]|nr:TonB-dependent receptor [Planctomycetaceae bacterium]
MVGGFEIPMDSLPVGPDRTVVPVVTMRAELAVRNGNDRCSACADRSGFDDESFCIVLAHCVDDDSAEVAHGGSPERSLRLRLGLTIMIARNGIWCRAGTLVLTVLLGSIPAIAQQSPTESRSVPLPTGRASSSVAAPVDDFVAADPDPLFPSPIFQAASSQLPPSAEAVPPAPAAADQPDLLDLPLEQLSVQPVRVQAPALEQVVTTVSGQKSSVGKSPAAVFVVTQEMIRRSGATCIPEVLRLVPGLNVVRVDSNKWSIASRGFNGDFGFSNKMLVLIDGRTVYSPLNAGVYWDVQDVLLDDIERIEVIRGPGATIWGANAVNGVINIITKKAADTQGTLVKVGGGSFERGFINQRVGGQIGDDVHYRVYGKLFDRGPTVNPIFGPPSDDWRQGRGGFRSDWTPTDEDTITLQGDYYQGKTGGFFPPQVRGGNVLTRWTHQVSDDHDFSLQAYIDRADRYESIFFNQQKITTSDVDFRHHVRINSDHNLVWGAGYRSISDKLSEFSYDPSERTYFMASTFAQDEITLIDDKLYLTLGTKLLTSTFAPFEVQPSARLLWSLDESRAAWAAVSRAVRTPSRQDRDLGFPTSPNFQSEELLAYEIGYREQPVEWFSWDAALFYNNYTKLQNVRFTQPDFFLVYANGDRGNGSGAELSATVDLSEHWRLSGWYSLVLMQIQVDSSPLAYPFILPLEGSSPKNQVFLMSSWDLSKNIEFDLMGRYVDSLPTQLVPSYTSMDARLAWRVNSHLELSMVGQNLLAAQHEEGIFFQGNQIPRGVYGMAACTW